MDIIPIEYFGKDHWGLFAYIETRCVDYKGKLDETHLRLNGIEYPTMLHGYFDDNTKVAEGHSDLDCMNDLVNAGLIEEIFDCCYKLTDYGWKIIGSLRKYKANGGVFATFTL